MQALYLILVVFTIVLRPLHPLSAQDNDFRIMTFNLRYPNPGDGIHYWDNRRPLVTGLIRFHEVDLLGVQEAHRRQIDEIVADIPEFDWFGVCRTDGKTNPYPDGEFSAILYRKSRFKFLEGNTFWLSETPEVAGSKGWDAAYPRIVTWAKFEDMLTGKIFFHFNTHFDHLGVVARNESAKLLLQKIKLIAGEFPVIVTGDFNCGETEMPYHIMTNDSTAYHVTDAMTISKSPHYGPKATFAGNFEISGLIDHRIDFIFIRNKMEVLKHAILSDSWNGNLASDHLPVMAVVSSELNK
ncbi:MAG TPA: endonuclease/exonuclease/phosphatase family protein [Saprospiraceae bacterium]|nr:endonuclease/exonuclease/phosphatase family protein [Saprospiraceae bacterium]